MYRLVNPIQSYAWGSRSAIAELFGQPAPSAEPQAELWMGAHPSTPSGVIRDGVEQPLDAAIREAPRQLLGEDTVARFGPRLPFLLKLLAVERPLSLQAHPDQAQASSGFAAEQARGIPLDDPRRNYRDANHKPELICAVTPFAALSGLRPVAELAEVLAELAVPRLAPLTEALVGDAGADGVRSLLTSILQVSDPGGLARSVQEACLHRVALGGRYTKSYRVVLNLADRFPGDPGVAASLLLNPIQLRPGQATYVPPGRLHTYLSGVGIEIMATSDNVVRGGLTDKRVDVLDLISLLEPRCGVPELVDGQSDGSGWCDYPTPAADFALSRATLDHGSISSDIPGPQILFCVEGALTLAGQPLARGQSAFVPAGHLLAITGTGTVFRATTGLG